MALPAIERIAVSGSQIRQDGGNYYAVYQIDLTSTTSLQWSVQRRFSQFQQLHLQWLNRWPTIPVPTKLPSRTLLRSSSTTDRVRRDRQAQLDHYLNAILWHRDPRWRQSIEWQIFLGMQKATNTATDEMIGGNPDNSVRRLIEESSDRWMAEYRNLQSISQQLQTLITCNQRKDTDSPVTTQQRSVTREVDEDNSLNQIRKLLATLSRQLASLSNALEALLTGGKITERESLRRRDLLTTLRQDKDRYQQALLTLQPQSTGNQWETPVNFNSSTSMPQTVSQSTSHWSSVQSTPAQARSTPQWSRGAGRVLGVPAVRVEETEETKHLDNRGVLELQTSHLALQDQQLDQLISVVSRQKEIGLAIGDELDQQNQIISTLDDRVDLANARMRNANRMAKKLN